MPLYGGGLGKTGHEADDDKERKKSLGPKGNAVDRGQDG